MNKHIAGTNNTGIYDMVSYIRCRMDNDDIFGFGIISTKFTNECDC